MFDTFYISCDESEVEIKKNFENLREHVPTARRVVGIRGIHNAHLAAASAARTDHFFTVDADNWVYEDFTQMLDEYPKEDAVYVFRCLNPVNDLVYGYGAVKLFPTKLLREMPWSTVDMTTSISADYRIINKVVSETRFNTSEFDAWKSGFRECAKLASKIIDRQNDAETEERLRIWTTKGQNRQYGTWCIYGAIAGREYGRQNKDNPEALAKINDFQWLFNRFMGRMQ